MSMYPSLEDMKVDQIQQAQVNVAAQQYQGSQTPRYSENNQSYLPYPTAPGAGGAPVPTGLASAYPSAALMDEYMGLKFEPPTGPYEVPPAAAYNGAVVQSGGFNVAIPAGQAGRQMVAPISGGDLGLARANLTHGVREVVTCKNAKGKVGMRLRDVNKGVFVQFVDNGSPAAMAGIRFGDQILQINGKDMAGVSGDKAMEMLKKSPANNITLAVRDRPFERTVTLHKDSSGHVGFVFKENKITQIAKETSAARNGLLIDHYMLEVNGQNVVGMKQKEVADVLANCGPIVTITIMPEPLYNHVTKCLGDYLLRKKMDHSVPEVF